MTLQLSNSELQCNNRIILLPKGPISEDIGLHSDEAAYVNRQQQAQKKDIVIVNRFTDCLYLVFVKTSDEENKRMEACRRLGFQVLTQLNGSGEEAAKLEAHNVETNDVLSFAEGMALGNYQFIKYRKDAGEKTNSLKQLFVHHQNIDNTMLNQLSVRVEATLWARDLVNEPLNFLNATDLAYSISENVKSVGGRAEIFSKEKIEALKMGGLLAVNRGSIDPPTFTILEWKPENTINSQPIILVGKGVVYDTGGLSLKPSASMETMKCDMAGAAAVAASIYAAAKLKLPFHLIALVPATDNRVNGNAYVPGDVITMFDGTTVEVLNTDAEGRLLLADALSFAKTHSPSLVINFATLTGAASRAIGSQGLVAMQVNASESYAKLNVAGNMVYERLVEFPMWEEYKEQLKSEIADLKNIGGPEAGMITAGKFLEHFTDYPFIHIDIAGPAFIDKRDNYRGQGGTGVGVRLMLAFLTDMTNAS